MTVVLTERPFAYNTGQGTLEIHVQLLGGAVGSGMSAGEELLCEVMNGEDRLSSLFADYDFEWCFLCTDMMPN